MIPALGRRRSRGDPGGARSITNACRFRQSKRVTLAFFPFWPFPSLSPRPTRDGRHGRSRTRARSSSARWSSMIGRVHADGAHGGGDGARASPDPPGRGVRVRRCPHRGTAHGLRGKRRRCAARRGAAERMLADARYVEATRRSPPIASARPADRRRPSLDAPPPPPPPKTKPTSADLRRRDPLLSPAETFPVLQAGMPPVILLTGSCRFGRRLEATCRWSVWAPRSRR